MPYFVIIDIKQYRHPQVLTAMMLLQEEDLTPLTPPPSVSTAFLPSPPNLPPLTPPPSRSTAPVSSSIPPLHLSEPTDSEDISLSESTDEAITETGDPCTEGSSSGTNSDLKGTNAKTSSSFIQHETGVSTHNLKTKTRFIMTNMRTDLIMMLNPEAVRDLLTANVDHDVSHFALFTDHGTLLGHDNTIVVAKARSFCGLTGGTWRLHETELQNKGYALLTTSIAKGVTTLSATVKADGSGLRQMIIEWDGIVGAVAPVKPRLLVAALSTREEFELEVDEVARKIQGLALGKKVHAEMSDEESKAPVEAGKENMELTEVEHEGDPTITASSMRKEGNIDSVVESKDKGKGLGETDASVAERKAEEYKPSKIRILELKADAMAEHIAMDFPGKLPNDFW